MKGQAKTQEITKIAAKLDSVVLVIFSIKNYQDMISKFLRIVVKEKKIPTLYINLNKPYDTLKKNLAKEHIDTDDILFIDSVTTIWSESSKLKNCLYLGHHQNLTDISIAASEAVSALKGEKKVVVVDSINNLLIYNDYQTVLRFSRFLIEKIRSWKAGGIIFILREKSSEDLIKELTQASDLVLDFGGE